MPHPHTRKRVYIRPQAKRFAGCSGELLGVDEDGQMLIDVWAPTSPRNPDKPVKFDPRDVQVT